MEELRDIIKEYPGQIVALQGITLEVAEQEVLGVVGPNGAGKTTLLRIMALLDAPTNGQVFFKGHEVTAANIDVLRKNVTMVFQRTAMFDTTVFRNVAYGLRLQGISGKELETRVRRALQIVGLKPAEQRPAKSLSGGEQQLVAIARALALDPELLILDEPMANLDPIYAARIEHLVLELRDETTIVHTTQNVALAARLSDKLAFLLEGKLIQVGSVDEVLTRPIDARVAQLVGFENIFEGNIVSVEEGIARISIEEGFELEAVTAKRGRCVVAIRPEDIVVSKRRLRSSMRNTFEGKIVRVTDAGPLVRIVVDAHGLPLTALLTRRSFRDLGLHKGGDVQVSFKASCVHVI